MDVIIENEFILFVKEQGWKAAKGIQTVTHPAMLLGDEGLWQLDQNRLDQIAEQEKDRLMTIYEETGIFMAKSEGEIGESGISLAELEKKIQGRQVFLVNAAWMSEQKGRESVSRKPERQKQVVHLLALGDVGGTVLTALKLLGGELVERIGILDISPAMCQRWEYEMNQTAYPWDYDRLPEVTVLEKEQLFDCDVLVFCASKGVPKVGSAVGDVRMAQFEENRKLVELYGAEAREKQFQGLFAVVSDPVDPLCKALFLASNRGEDGRFDGRGLRPEQIQGYGLGVMNSRAAYYAKKDSRFTSFLTEGRAFGPHGQDLVIANSILDYDKICSEELTVLARDANLKTRELGFKPYIAPALSSAAISILLTLEGRWHYSSNYLGGVYMGCKNRTVNGAVELESLPLPEELYEQLERAYQGLEAII